MLINIEDKFVLEPEYGKFNLYKYKKNVDKEGKETIRGASIGYGMSLNNSIKRMVSLTVEQRKEVVDLSKYVSIYEKELKSLTSKIDLG